MNDQLRELVRQFPTSLIERKPGRGGGDYVTHSVVNERLLQTLGPFDFGLVEVIRGHAPEYKTSSKTHAAREGAIVGVVARLTATIDGRTVTVEEVGAEDNPAGQTDAQNLKNAMSDALKRCAMRFGLGLHLWSQEHYFLDRALPAEHTPATESAAPSGNTIGDDEEFPPDPPPEALAATPEQIKAIGAGLASVEVGREDARAFVSWLIDRDVASARDLTEAEATRIIERFKDLRTKSGFNKHSLTDALDEWRSHRQEAAA